MPRRQLDGWKFDIARAAATNILFTAGMLLGLWRLYFDAGWLLLLAFFGGAWPAAWIACKLLPSGRPRLIVRLAVGVYAGLILCIVSGSALSLLPDKPFSDPRVRFMAQHDAALVIFPFFIFVFSCPLILSRWKNRPMETAAK